MGDVRTERGDLDWKRMAGSIVDTVHLTPEDEVNETLVWQLKRYFATELASWQARAERAESTLEEIRRVASGELQVAADDTDGMAWIDRRAANALASACPTKGWRCFHCDFVTTDPEEAQAHFGDRDDAEEFKPICKWWAGMDDDERKHAFQDLQRALTREQEDGANQAERIRVLESTIAARKKDAMSEANTPIRMHIALKMARAWSLGDDFDGQVTVILRQWIDGGMKGSIPWPKGNPFFDDWAERNGLSDCGGYVGFMCSVQLTAGAVHETKDGVLSRSTDLEREDGK